MTTQDTDQFRQQDLAGRLDPLPPTPVEIRAWAVEIADVLTVEFASNPDLWQSISHRFDDEGNVIRCGPGDTEIVDAVRAELRKIAGEVTRRG